MKVRERKWDRARVKGGERFEEEWAKEVNV